MYTKFHENPFNGQIFNPAFIPNTAISKTSACVVTMSIQHIVDKRRAYFTKLHIYVMIQE